MANGSAGDSTWVVQTNEPGPSTVLYPALLWLTARHRRSIRLLEIGASAGLSYVTGGQQLGNPWCAST